ncbi:MAG: PAS domain-containing sensor histidine kinase, partial [Bartonella sp.]|nr:PAS domain-containing sensor histidine kinase [Bartonella sp.]
TARSTLSLLSSSILNKIDHDLLAFTQQKKVASLSPNHLQNILITLHHHSSTNINPMIAILDRNGNILASSNSEIISGESLQDFISEKIDSWPL